MATYPVYDPYPIITAPKNRFPTLEPKYSPEQISAQGIWIRWETASRCPCTKLDGRQGPKMDCPVCGGFGYIYHTPQDTQALIQSGSLSPKIFNQSFVFLPGELYLSVRGEHCPSNMDRITILEGRIRVSLLRTRLTDRATEDGEDSLETLPFPIAKKTIEKPTTSGDGLGGSDEYNLGVVYLRSMDAGTDDVGPILTQGEDFEVEYNAEGLGQLNWAVGDLKDDPITPDVGDTFTITYFTMPIYRVVDFPHSIRITRVAEKHPLGIDTSLPVQFECKLSQDMRDLFDSED